MTLVCRNHFFFVQPDNMDILIHKYRFSLFIKININFFIDLTLIILYYPKEYERVYFKEIPYGSIFWSFCEWRGTFQNP